MSSPILPAQGPLGSTDSTTTPATTTEIGDVGAFIDQLAGGVGALSIDAARGGPPPEVLEQIATTAQIAERMREQGFEVRFFTAAERGRTCIELHDADGAVVGNLSTVDALELAAGGLYAY
jgi:hypothetical protein